MRSDEFSKEKVPEVLKEYLELKKKQKEET